MTPLTDTHCHIYLEEYDFDREEVIEQAKAAGIRAIFMPNVDGETILPMLKVADQHPGYCFPMMGLHPTSVDADYTKSLAEIERRLGERPYVAIGEIGLDLYWDKSFYKEQIDAFVTQVKWAQELNLPVSVHVREAFAEMRAVFEKFETKNVNGVFHCFSGSADDARWVVEQTPFFLGITGTVTYKNSSLPEILSAVPLGKILIETDAPYLSPVPYRGKRNHPAYLSEVVKMLAQIYKTDEETVRLTTETSVKRLF